MSNLYRGLLVIPLLIVVFTACDNADNQVEPTTITVNEESQATVKAPVPDEEESVVEESSGDQDEQPADASPTRAAESNPERTFAGTVPAPEFPVGLDWLNTSDPLSLADLRGKIVLLDFWTYGCINCMHIIPDLRMLEEKYADELVVIGVHSAKFENESDTENIRQVILRYELEHPVVNDHDFQIWSQYGAQAWPTLVIIDPEGNVLGYHSGEGIFEPFDVVISGMIEEFDELGRIDRTPLNLLLEKENQLDSPLLFPGKVLADEEEERLFIADSNHNRLVVTDLRGSVIDVIGNGQSGLKDGDFESASFFRPQGMALADGEILYVADTENHAIRAVDLANRSVETVAGTGEQEYMRFPVLYAEGAALNSPWDVLYHDNLLYIAMAGQHQIWTFDPANNSIKIFAGSGREELKDGSLTSGGLNQPSGLATDGEVLFIADSEASAIRSADLGPDEQLNTIVGAGLFDFGDVDGIGDDVRLQHPLGVALHDGDLYVADTYNSKIKRINLENNESISLLGGSESGWQDGAEALFDEPGGLSIAGDRLYIADTNNHVIRVADLNSLETETLVLIDTEGHLTRLAAGEEYSGKRVALNPLTTTAGQTNVILDLKLPDGYKLNDLAPFSMEWTSDTEEVLLDPETSTLRMAGPELPIIFPAELAPGEAALSGDLVIYYCEEEAQSLCLIDRVRIHQPLTIVDGADAPEITISYEIPGPE